MNIEQANANRQAKAIEQTRNDPDFMSTGMCPECVMVHPCLCDRDRAVEKMRAYYERHRRNWFRREPRGVKSYGRRYDVLMTELYKIAENEIVEAQRAAAIRTLK